MKKWIGILVIFLGLGLIAYPFYAEYEQNKEVRALEEAMELIMSTDEGKEVDLSEIEHLPFTEEEIRNVMELEIPYLNIRHKVLDTTTPENLNLALTQIKEEQTPGEGNFTIAGHRGYRDGRHFSNLAEVPIGEEVYLHVGSTKYIYQITDRDVVEATDVHVLDDREGIDELTMITCTISGKQRVAVRAKLLDIVSV
ncbi:MAG TPA: class D sortase [Savagea sp.]